jgi:hypothetical protein
MKTRAAVCAGVPCVAQATALNSAAVL